MPWCPKCKNEYRKGIIVCADCNTPLVDELVEETVKAEVFSTPVEELANRFIEFLKYSDIQSGTFAYSEEKEGFVVSVDEKDLKQAKKLFKGFAITESENAVKKELEKMAAVNQVPNLEEGEELSEEELAQIAEGAVLAENSEDAENTNNSDNAVSKKITNEEEEAKEISKNLRGPAKVYTKQKDKYNDLNSTAYTFLVVGIAGLGFVAANLLGFVSMLNNTLSTVLYTAIFAGCLYVAYISFRDAKKAKAQIQGEEDLTAKVEKWLEENIKEETFAEVVDEELGEEANYLNKLEHMSKLLAEKFPELDEDYADQLCEEFYGKKFE